jgi:peroxiredoxin
MVRKITVSLALSVCLAFVAARCSAEPPKIGDPGPAWSALPGADDKGHSLADYKDAKVIVLAFMCNHCPVAKAYEDRLMKIQSDYKAKGVQVVAVNVNNIEADRLDKMKERAKDRGFNYPYLYDASQKIARDYGAKVTPHIFVLNSDRKLVYMGAVDDKQDETAVTKHYLRDAIDAVLVGKEPPEAVTKQFGCGIRYE